MTGRPSFTALALSLLLCLLLAGCGGKEYAHEMLPDEQYDVDRYNCEWDITHANPDIDGDELDRRVEKCLADKGWKEKVETPEEEKGEDDSSWWWPW